VTPIPGKQSQLRLVSSRALRATIVAGIIASSAAATVAPSIARAATEHTVQPGESISSIAARYGLPVQTLLDVNGIADPDSVAAGTILQIPTYAVAAPPDVAPGNYHTVESGDTLSSIAVRFGVSPAELAEANGIFDLHSVIAGATLLIPETVPGESGSGGGGEEELVIGGAAMQHTVAAGETLFEIATNYGVRLESIVAANGLSNPNLVVVGQMLAIPGAGETGPSTGAAADVVHIVGQGETLSSIADKYGVGLSALADANNLADHDHIVLGEKLVIPGALTPSQTTGYDGVSHVVQLGDTLSGLAEAYGVSVSSLIEANGIADANILIAGSQLNVPGAANGASVAAPEITPAMQTHVVAPGETLSAIANRYGVTVAAIIATNGLVDANRIVEGQALAIPGVISSRVYSLDEYALILENAAAEFGVSPALIKALAWHESGWNQYAVSWAGAVGLMQIMPYTADWALLTLVPGATDWDTDPRDNARMGVAILHHWLERSGWDTPTALAAYYQGWRSLHEIGMYDETVDYIANIMALVAQFE
jgi:LysM repeat protein